MAIFKKLDVIIPQSNEPVTIIQNIDCATGSKAINDEFHDMFLSINGKLIGPLGPGRYDLDTQSSPFFTGLRYFPTGGRAPINVSVFYVSKQNFTQQWGTGEFVCNENVVGIPFPIRVAAGGTMTFKVSNSRLFLKSLVGLRGFNVDDISASTRTLLIPSIRDALVERMGTENFATAQANVSAISTAVSPLLATEISTFGLSLTQFVLTCFNINNEDFAKLQKYNEKRLSNATDLEAAKNELDTIYGGNVYDKAKVEALINLSKASGDSGGISRLALLPMLMSVGREMSNQLGDVFSAPRSARPIPSTCPHCNNTYEGNYRFCPHCGHRIN